MPPIPEESKHAFRAAVTTLTLGILGSSVLPIPFSFSRTGILPGIFLATIVALCNTYTGTVILRAAAFLKKSTYEGVCHAAWRSSTWRTIAQLALLALLFGTLAGDAALLADTGTLALKQLTKDGTHLPRWIIGDSRVPMCFLVFGLVLPLSLSKQMRSLEKAAAGGIVLVFILAVIIIISAVGADFPAIRNGELPIFQPLPGSTRELPEAISVLSFAFYTTPMLLPLRSEMPAGREGVDIMCRAVQLVTSVIALFVYGITGCFAAARWGLETQGDVLVNEWLPDAYNGGLNAAMAVYLSISMSPMVITMRYLLDSVMASGEFVEYSRKRDVGLTLACILSSTAVAAACPEKAEELFAVTGASAVCLVAYIFPIIVHLKLYFRGVWRGTSTLLAELEAEEGPHTWLLEDASLLEHGESYQIADTAGIFSGDLPIRGGSGEDDHLSLDTEFDGPGRRDSSVVDAELQEESVDVNDGMGVGNLASSSVFINQRRQQRQRMWYPHVRDVYKVKWWGVLVLLLWHVVVPLMVMVFGIVTSGLALLLAMGKL